MTMDNPASTEHGIGRRRGVTSVADLTSGALDPWGHLPPAIRRRAEITGSGELLWPADTADALRSWLEAAGIGVIGGEVYIGLGKAKGAFHAEWETAPLWLPGEPWQRFVARSADQAAREIRGLDARLDAPSARYFLAVLPEERYPEYLRRR
jgi:hypothetical protein